MIYQPNQQPDAQKLQPEGALMPGEAEAMYHISGIAIHGAKGEATQGEIDAFFRLMVEIAQEIIADESGLQADLSDDSDAAHGVDGQEL